MDPFFFLYSVTLLYHKKTASYRKTIVQFQLHAVHTAIHFFPSPQECPGDGKVHEKTCLTETGYSVTAPGCLQWFLTFFICIHT